MPHFIIRHRSSGEKFRCEYHSKTSLKRSLPRYCEARQEYCSFWDVKEVTPEEYRKHRDAKSAALIWDEKSFTPKVA